MELVIEKHIFSVFQADEPVESAMLVPPKESKRGGQESGAEMDYASRISNLFISHALKVGKICSTFQCITFQQFPLILLQYEELFLVPC